MAATPTTRPPTASIARVASRTVAPDVTMSSTIRHGFPARRCGAVKDPVRLRARCSAVNPA
jgi:hypothetical protein